MNEDRYCDCGCGTVIYPGSYAHRIGTSFYAQKCVRLVIVPQAPAMPDPLGR